MLLPTSRALAQTVTIDNVTIVDVSSGRLQANKSIVVGGKRIARIEDASVATRATATIDGTGMFVIPGLWDMHVHAYFTNDTSRFHTTNDVMFPLFIVNGVTGVRDLGSNLDATLAARDSVAAHQLIGPRMLVSGPMIDGPTTRYAAAIKVTTGDEARAAVRMLKARGVDLIKTQTLVPKDAYFALADEAARIGIPFEGHVPREITGLEAVRAGQRSFEHMIGVTDTNTKLIAALAQNMVWQCPTVINSVGTSSDFANDPGIPYWLRSAVDGWRATAKTQAALPDSAARAANQRATRRLALVKQLYDAKIPLLAGTDAPAGYDLVPGASLHRELQLFVRAGLTPLQALQTATLNPARYFGKTDSWGTIEPGKVADLVLLARNPLVDIANTRQVVAVVADGRYYSPRELDRMRVRIMELVAK
ncbi:amidohydrolase family protein [Gemmatimonas groenlandica]|uniref:Amidohydrolase family protein n=2 Tax=Gemmatimonas groenlandica TaxID=2732249 RepID=A0A6M4IU78_9BACT|nr:amidohydrolase family protein [Gemmatimonas groenlandica]